MKLNKYSFILLLFVLLFSKNNIFAKDIEKSNNPSLISQKEKIYNELKDLTPDTAYTNFLFNDVLDEWNNLYSQITNHHIDPKFSTLCLWESYNTRIINLLEEYKFDSIPDADINKWKNDCKQLREEYEENLNLKRNESINEAINESFVVCLTFPLAVKFHKEGVDRAYNAAKQLIELNLISDRDYIDFWKTYSVLLNDYEKYNNEVIKFINTQKNVFNNNRKRGIITFEDINKIKKDIKGLKYGKYYKTENNIAYLDNVIDKFIGELERFAYENQNVSPNFFDAFINNNLKDIEPSKQKKDSRRERKNFNFLGGGL